LHLWHLGCSAAAVGWPTALGLGQLDAALAKRELLLPGLARLLLLGGAFVLVIFLALTAARRVLLALACEASCAALGLIGVVCGR
jgi:hypothetical protein